MKQFLLMLAMMPLASFAQDYYYYGHYDSWEKIPLTVNENKVCVSFFKDNKEVSERILANVQALDTIKDKDIFDIFVIPRSDFEKLTSMESWEEDSRSIIISSSYYIDNNDEVFATPYLNVKLKKEEDIDLLVSCAEKYRLKIVGSFSQNMPLWYVLYVTPDCNESPLECANVLFESGDFSAAVPDLAGMQAAVFAQEYFPEGTKWTEIRLDTLKYDNWYSQVGDEWVPNFETIEYYVRGEYPDRDWIYKKVYTNGPEWTDSLTLLIREAEYNGHNSVLVSIMTHNYDGESYVPWPGEAYQFDWSVGKGLYYEDITMSNTTSLVSPRFYYGIIDEIKEGNFGGSQSLKYVDLDGKAPDDKSNSPKRNVNTNGGRIIQGIGVTEWNDGECLFGPPNPYSAMSFDNPERHYRSMLVHFERNGEVLYDVWPEKKISDFVQDGYRPLVEQGKKWTYHHDTYQYVYDYHYTLEGDMVVAGKDCLKMYSENKYGDGERQFEGALFEENRKVYYFNFDKDKLLAEQPTLLYDFGCEVGDVFHMNAIELVTQAISAVEVNGKSVNRYDFQAQQPDEDDEPFVIGNLSWIEGVGATLDFFGMLPLPGNYNSLVACEVNGEVIYQSATSVQGIKSNTPNSDGAIFDLQGRRLSATPAKGVYIQNGKKRIVR